MSKNYFIRLYWILKIAYDSSKLYFFIISAIVLFTAVKALLISYLFKLIISSLSNQLFKEAVIFVILYSFLQIINGAFFEIERIIKSLFVIKIEINVSRKFMQKLNSIDLDSYENPKFYDKVYRAEKYFSEIPELLWSLIFLFTSVLTVLFLIAPFFKLGFFIVFLLLLNGIIPLFIYSKSNEYYWSALSNSDPDSRKALYYKKLMSDLAVKKELLIFSLFPWVKSKFEKYINKFVKKYNKSSFKRIYLQVISILIRAFIASYTAYVIIKNFFIGVFDISDIVFYFSLLFSYYEYSSDFFLMLTDIKKYLVLLGPLFEILEKKPKKKSGKIKLKKIKKGITFKNVYFKYKGSSKYAIKNFSAHIKAGESCALVGENGSGKTTLIKLLCRFYEPDKGQILIDDIDIREYDIDSLRSKISVIFQDFFKYEASLIENIAFSKKKSKRIDDLLEKINLKLELKKGFNTHLGKTIEFGEELSQGQWQKVALARALYKDSEILVLDEPTAAVDAKSELAIFKKFEELSKGRTTILISHRFSTIKLAKHIIVMHKGKKIEEGSHKELIKKKGVYAKLYKEQLLALK